MSTTLCYIIRKLSTRFKFMIIRGRFGWAAAGGISAIGSALLLHKTRTFFKLGAAHCEEAGDQVGIHGYCAFHRP